IRHRRREVVVNGRLPDRVHVEHVRTSRGQLAGQVQALRRGRDVAREERQVLTVGRGRGVHLVVVDGRVEREAGGEGRRAVLRRVRRGGDGPAQRRAAHRGGDVRVVLDAGLDLRPLLVV